MDWARVIRGTRSRLRLVTPRSARTFSSWALARGLQQADQHGSGAEQGSLVRRGRLYARHICFRQQRRGSVGQHGSGLGVGIIREERGHTRAAFHQKVNTGAGEPPGTFGRQA